MMMDVLLLRQLIPIVLVLLFVGDNIGYEELEDTDPKELTLTISRDKTEAAATVAIEVQANTENISTSPQSVSFAAGQATADLVITLKKHS
ncbi:hypothetical protein NXW09_28730 [Bacteroides ovatus]|nr:hypothetical protein [Bacteroides ovatus]